MDDLNSYMDEPGTQRTLRDSVSNGLLAYRPNLSTGQFEEAVEQPWAKRLGLKLGNHRMDKGWTSNRYAWLDKQGKPLGPSPEPERSLLEGESDQHHAGLEPKLLRELNGMEDVEYEAKLDEEGKPIEAIEIELDFDVRTWSEDELNDLVLSGQWMEKLSSLRVGRLKHYDPLLQKVYKPKKSSKQAGKRRMKLRAKHATRGEAFWASCRRRST